MWLMHSQQQIDDSFPVTTSTACLPMNKEDRIFTQTCTRILGRILSRIANWLVLGSTWITSATTTSVKSSREWMQGLYTSYLLMKCKNLHYFCLNFQVSRWTKYRNIKFSYLRRVKPNFGPKILRQTTKCIACISGQALWCIQNCSKWRPAAYEISASLLVKTDWDSQKLISNPQNCAVTSHSWPNFVRNFYYDLLGKQWPVWPRILNLNSTTWKTSFQWICLLPASTMAKANYIYNIV